MRFFYVLWIFLALPLAAHLQEPVQQPVAAEAAAMLSIHDIVISGNEKTKPATILREIPIEPGNEYAPEVLQKKIAAAKVQLMNTGLFRIVNISQEATSMGTVVHVKVEERWYLFPVPFVRPVDNSFFQWATESNRDFSRLNYGIRLTHRNLTGRSDRLTVNFTNGFTRQLALQYNNLFLDSDMQWSANLSLGYGNNRAVNYMTDQNKLVPLRTANEDFVHSFFRTNAEISYRKLIKTKHSFGLGYSKESVADTVMQLNPQFSPGRKTYSSTDVYYRVSYTDVDFIPYPTKGFLAEASLMKRGIGSPLDLWQFTARTSATWPAMKNSFFNLRFAGMLKLPFDQPYITQRFIGHDNMFLQGYEEYVIDGVAGGYMKATFARSLFNKKLNLPDSRLEPLKKVKQLPLQVYAKAFINAGYIYNEEPGTNYLSNKMLYSGGIGLDIITLTDFVIKLEWSFNLLGQNNLYLHPRNSF